MGINRFFIFFCFKSELDAFLHVYSSNSYLLVKQNLLGLNNEMGIKEKYRKWQPRKLVSLARHCILNKSTV